jgi:CRP/FNR family transcriptional regulator, cyclic AMP receptor protein
MVSHARNECILAFLSPGAIVGEMSIIDRLPRSASVVAVRPAVLSFLSSADFKALGVRILGDAARTFLPLRGRVARTGSRRKAQFCVDYHIRHAVPA